MAVLIGILVLLEQNAANAWICRWEAGCRYEQAC
jgi:hypothetical protein